MILAALSMYRERDRVFGVMPEPQWRILLDLAANGDCTVTSAAIASGAAPTTALRHIGQLEKAGLVWRRDDSVDRRKHWLSLTEEAANRLSLIEQPQSTAPDMAARAGKAGPPVGFSGATPLAN